MVRRSSVVNCVLFPIPAGWLCVQRILAIDSNQQPFRALAVPCTFEAAVDLEEEERGITNWISNEVLIYIHLRLCLFDLSWH